MLVKDETEGCISRTLPKATLSQPHSSSMIDLDGDCVSDLFLTVKDLASGLSYYEIYLRRERTMPMKEDDDIITVTGGLNSYCLVAREEIQPQSMFSFTDIDRDGMIDMVL
jgi:hypothetical protein